IDERLHRADARQVRGEIFGPAPEPAYLANGLVRGRSPRGSDVGAGFGERKRDPLPDAGIGAGDERDFSRKVEHLHRSVLSFRHPGLDPGSMTCCASLAYGSRIKSGMTKEARTAL